VHYLYANGNKQRDTEKQTFKTDYDIILYVHTPLPRGGVHAVRDATHPMMKPEILQAKQYSAANTLPTSISKGVSKTEQEFISGGLGWAEQSLEDVTLRGYYV